jgi:hypothetical protein
MSVGSTIRRQVTEVHAPTETEPADETGEDVTSAQGSPRRPQRASKEEATP